MMNQYAKRAEGIGIWTTFLVIGLVFYCVSVSTSCMAAPPAYGGKYNIPLSSDPESLDPAFITDIYAVNVANNLFDGLVEFDKNLNIVPALAEFWKISRDHRLYTFQLRKGVQFHNGREVTAEDFVFSFSRILQPALHSPMAPLFLHIKGAGPFAEGKSPAIAGLNAPERYTLTIQLDQPFEPFLSILAMAAAKVIPKEVAGPDFSRHPVGTGPFKFDRWKKGKEIVLTANDRYYLGRPYLDSIYFQIYPNIEWERVFADFERGFLDQSIIPSNKYHLITSDTQCLEHYVLTSKPSLNLVYIGMNVEQFPLNDVRVRQALSHAVDIKTTVTQITRRGSVPAKGILPPGIAGFDPEFMGYDYNPEKARKLLAKAGFPKGRGIPPLEIWTVSKSESVRQELEAFQRDLSHIGISITIRVADNWKHFLALIDAKKVPLFYAAWYADYPDPDNFLHVLCHSTSRTNRMGYGNPEIDRLLENARREVDYMKRMRIYSEIERCVMEDAPLIAHHVNSFNYLFQPWVKGVQVGYLGVAYIPYRKIWIDYSGVAK